MTRGWILAVVVILTAALTGCFTTPQSYEAMTDAEQSVGGDLAPTTPAANTAEERPKPPDHVVLHSPFDEYGMEFVVVPPREVGFETELVLTTAKPVEIHGALYAGAETSGRVVEPVMADGAWRMSFTFPHAGEYRLSVSIREPGSTENRYYGAAEVRVTSVFPEGLSMYGWTGGGERARLLLRDVRAVSEPWPVRPSQLGYQAATLAEPATISANGGRLALPAGTYVEFPAGAELEIRSIAVRLGEPYTLLASGEQLIFAAGSMLAVSSWDTIGVITQARAIDVLGGTVDLPPGTSVTVRNGSLEHASLDPPVPLVLPGGRIDVSSVQWRSSGAYTLIHLYLEGAAVVELGGARFDLRDITTIATIGSAPLWVHSYLPFTVTAAGEQIEITPDQSAVFDENGLFAGAEQGK